MTSKPKRTTLSLLAISALCSMLFAGSASAIERHKETPSDGWTTYVSDEFGYSVYYPSAYFEPNAIAAKGEPKRFLAPDNTAKLVVSGVNNDEGFTLKGYRKTLINEFGGYDDLTYAPVGRTYFVLSGYRGDQIYYQKVMFSCDSQIINIFSVTFPAKQRPFYSGLIEVMEDRFKPGRGDAAPSRCRPS